jgi:hypothetical protein
LRPCLRLRGHDVVCKAGGIAAAEQHENRENETAAHGGSGWFGIKQELAPKPA